MTAKVGYFDPILERTLDCGEVAAIATIQTVFAVDALSPTVNADCLSLWETIQEWSEEGKEFVSLSDLLRTIKKEIAGFTDTALCNPEVLDPGTYYADFFEYLDKVYSTFRSFL